MPAQAGNGQPPVALSLTPSAVPAVAGAQFSVTVHLDVPPGVPGPEPSHIVTFLKLQLRFDPNVFQAVSFMRGNQLPTSAWTTFESGVDNSAGMMYLSEGSGIDPGLWIQSSTDVAVATLQVRAGVPPVQSCIGWVAAMALSASSNDQASENVVGSVEGAAVNVGSPSGTAPCLGGRYTPLTPARILDTRTGIGGFSSPVPAAATIDVQVTGQGGVPASGVSAVAMNVTVTQPTAAGFLTLFPTGRPRPLAANLNFTPGKTVPNLVVAKVGAGGKVSLYNSAGSTQVVFDVAGWYSDTAGSGNDGRYTALVPARILDTRDGTGGGTRLGPGASLDLQVSGRGGVPVSGATAAVLNVAVTSTTATSFLTVFPAGVARPLAANLNFLSGDTVSNRVMATLGAGGKVSIYNNAGSTDVVVDVVGWYSDATLALSSADYTPRTYTPLVPTRILDTRDGTGGFSGRIAAGTSVDVQVTGLAGVPTIGVSAVVLNATVTQPTGPGFLTISPTGTPMPLASDLNYAAGETRPNLVVVRVGTGGKVNLYSWSGAHVVFDVAGWIS